MAEDRTHVEYVTGSSVRSAVVRAIADGTCSMDALLEDVDASESAVYGAVSELRGRGVVADADELVLTGIGEIVSDALSRLDATGSLLAGDPEYWRTHCVNVLPARFRTELTALADCDIVRATETDPHRAVRTVARRLGRSTSAAVATPIYQDEYAMQLPAVEDLRLLVNRAVVEETLPDINDDDVRPPDDAEIRVGNVEFALTVTDEAVMLSLPKVDGGYDTRSELIAEQNRALEWGRRLYDHCWERARPLAEFAR